MLEKEVFQRPLSEGEKDFLFLILIHSALVRPYINTFIKNSVFVTQNRIFLNSTYSVKKEKKCLIAFFPYLRLVNPEGALEILDLYAKTKGIYFGTGSKRDTTAWYQLYLYTQLTHAPVVYKNAFVEISKLPSAEIRALIFRLLKILLYVDYLGTQHYFGLSRKESVDTERSTDGLNDLKKGNPYPEGLGVFIDLEDMLLVFYHIEYLISLVTGIFDNLADETASLHNISFKERNRISLSNATGNDFLRELSSLHPNLKKHIDQNRAFINLIYSFREKVVHGEGLPRMISPIGAHWSNFIPIDSQIKNSISQCGDKTSQYGIITEWGVLQTNTNLYLDPFYFARSIARKLVNFCDEYLRLLRFDKYSHYVNRSHVFMNAMKYFHENGLCKL